MNSQITLMLYNNQIFRVFKHAFVTKRLDLTIFVVIVNVVLLTILFLNLYSTSFSASNIYDKFLDPLISISTVLIAVSIYYKQLYDDWVKSLPLKLTAHFMKDNKYIMTCHKAVLVSEADIRNWTQQIGAQMNSGEHLQFKPFFKVNNSRKIIIEQKGAYVFYEITYFLSFLPGEETDKKDKDGKAIVAKGNTDLKTKYLVWWDNDPDTPKNESVFFDLHPTSPKTEAEAIVEKSKTILSK